MVLLRRVIGDALRARRQAQQRTLREVSTAANVSLGYLSEIERGQKEASSELLSSICDALGAPRGTAEDDPACPSRARRRRQRTRRGLRRLSGLNRDVAGT
jgi:transcriptional regulator with XRE-family HTH domain